VANLDGFWSYVHDDDDADNGRISQLARDVVKQFEMLTGEKISLFLDRDKIDWGENWKTKIDTSLATVGFFVPVLTPRYFQSAECRRELQAFAHLATDLGIKDLILPLLYVDVSGIHDQTPTDELIQLVQTFQWVDWRDLRFLDVNSAGYRRGVAQLAARLVDANKRAEEVSITALPQERDLESASSDEEPGFIDLLADFEEKLQNSPQTLTQIGEEMKAIAALMREATANMAENSIPKLAFANKLKVARRLAQQLHGPTEQIWTLSNELSSELHSIDKGYRVLIERAPIEIENDPNSRESFCKLFNSIRNMSASADEALQSVQVMINATEPLDKMSRDLRPLMRRLRQGLMIQMELKELSREWLNLIEASSIKCDDMDV